MLRSGWSQLHPRLALPAVVFKTHTMGWQSYFVPFSTLTELEEALAVVHEHNTAEWDEADDDKNPGEELVSIAYARFERPYKGGGRRGAYCLLFGNSGGRYNSFMFLRRRRVNAQFYDRNAEARLGPLVDKATIVAELGAAT